MVVTGGDASNLSIERLCVCSKWLTRTSFSQRGRQGEEIESLFFFYHDGLKSAAFTLRTTVIRCSNEHTTVAWRTVFLAEILNREWLVIILVAARKICTLLEQIGGGGTLLAQTKR